MNQILSDIEIDELYFAPDQQNARQFARSIERAVMTKQAEKIIELTAINARLTDTSAEIIAELNKEQSLNTELLAKLREQKPDQTMIECVAGAISKHISTNLYQREVIAAAQYIVHRYCNPAPSAVTQVTCQIYGHVVGACDECNTHAENDINETIKILANNYIELTCGDSSLIVPEWQPIATAPIDENVMLTDGESVAEGVFFSGSWRWNRNENIAFATHWMPLPKPPMAVARSGE